MFMYLYTAADTPIYNATATSVFLQLRAVEPIVGQGIDHLNPQYLYIYTHTHTHMYIYYAYTYLLRVTGCRPPCSTCHCR